METSNQPLVSVPIITYNSAKYVLETLESIKAQTYQNIELIISDDCSMDDTVELCQKWVEQNKEHFVRTQIITSETNTGVSANLNRAEAACQGEWVKPIAGDDLLSTNCVEVCVKYAMKYNPVCLFGRIKAFGASPERNVFYDDNVFDYTFFALSVEEQLEQLIFKGNCVPAATYFYNRSKIIEYGITNDERIPLLEDWPKWIVALEKGIKFHFIDEFLVNYRIHEASLSTSGRASSKMVMSNQLFNFYYRYPKWENRNKEEAVKRMTTEYVQIYEELLKMENLYNQIRSSHAYRLGKLLLNPLKIFKK